MSKYDDECGHLAMTCNSCGEETIYSDCCDDGEVVHFRDCDCDECLG